MSSSSLATDSIAAALYQKRKVYPELHPLKREAEAFITELLALLFPHHSPEPIAAEAEAAARLDALRGRLESMAETLRAAIGWRGAPDFEAFFAALPEVHDKLAKDAECIYKGDPAARSIDEVILSYPGFLAIAMYRAAHELHRLGLPIAPRIITEFAHRQTGIDVHPGASIGNPFCMDHGTGIVIGETTVIGNCVKIYQGVTLGALSVDKSFADTRRHPTIEDRVIIYAGATILGGETVIGHDSVIGGNVWITSSVAPHSIVHRRTVDKVKPGKPAADGTVSTDGTAPEGRTDDASGGFGSENGGQNNPSLLL